MKKHALTVAAYVAATFVTQASSHFLLAADHYATLTHIRKEPLFQFGMLAMLIQGVILSFFYAKLCDDRESTIKRALFFSWTMGAFLVSYISFAEPAKYVVPSTMTWIAVELAAGLVQFSIFGMLLGVIYRRASDAIALNSRRAG